MSVVVLHESHVRAFPLETVLSIENVKSGFLSGKRNIAKSVSVTVPARALLVSDIGSLRIAFFKIISTAFLTVVEGSAVMSGCEAKLSSDVLWKYLLRSSLSVTIPKWNILLRYNDLNNKE